MKELRSVMNLWPGGGESRKSSICTPFSKAFKLMESSHSIERFERGLNSKLPNNNQLFAPDRGRRNRKTLEAMFLLIRNAICLLQVSK